jgi:hypothetical protein
MSVCCECCVLSEVSATGWSLVQRSPTECVVSCDRESSKMRRPWSTGSCYTMVKKKRFIATITTAQNLSLYWDASNKSMPTPHLLKTHFNIVLPSTPRSSNSSLSLKFLQQTLYGALLSQIKSSYCNWKDVWEICKSKSRIKKVNNSKIDERITIQLLRITKY